jgi:hypothetical protein
MRPDEAKCSWCGQDFQARRGGSPRRFCSAEHRSLFWSALRRWGERAVADGTLTIADIRNGDPAACTLLGAAVSPPPVSPGHVQPGEALGLADVTAEIGEGTPSEAQPWAAPTQPFEVDSAWLWSRRLALWQRWRRWAPQWGHRPTRMAAKRRATCCNLPIGPRLRLGP